VKVDETRLPPDLTAAEGRGPGRAVRPRDAATLIILRRGRGEPQVLMGRRAAAHRFMPNKFVFPGGRVDPCDSRIRPPHDLHPAVMQRLCRGCSEVRARALALAAIRETYEETGLIVGAAGAPTLRSRSPHWAAFLRHGANPRLDVLQYIARAITPPHRGQRFDARFFLVDAEHLHGEWRESPQGSGELLDLQWIGLRRALEMSRLPLITHTVLMELQRRLDASAGLDAAGPFIYFRRSRSVVEWV